MEKTNIKLKDFLNEYINSKLKNKKHSLNDILQIVAYLIIAKKEYILCNLDNIYLTEEENIKLETLLDMFYFKYIPLQYITKSQRFFKEKYIVNENVLIPREDTEILVSKGIEYIEKYRLHTLIDMCSGSGCIGISIAKNSNILSVILADISSAASLIQMENAKLNKVEEKINIITSDLFSFYNPKDKKIDMIISNPPYIKSDDISNLSKYVQNEPRLALDGGVTGLDIYERILKEAKMVLKKSGFLLFEIGYDELESITELILNIKGYEIVENVKDFGKNDRVIVCRFLGI